MTGILMSGEISAGMKAGRGPAGTLLRDEELAGRIRDAVKNGQPATADLTHASRQADALMADLNSRGIPTKAGEVMDNLDDTFTQIRRLVTDRSAEAQFLIARLL